MRGGKRRADGRWIEGHGKEIGKGRAGERGRRSPKTDLAFATALLHCAFEWIIIHN